MKSIAIKAYQKVKVFFSRLQFRQKITIIILIFAVVPFLFMGPALLIGQWNTRVNEVLEVYKNKIKYTTETISKMVMAEFQMFPYISTNANLVTILSTAYNPNNIAEYSLIYSAYQKAREDFSIFRLNGYNTLINVYSLDDSVYESEYSLNIQSLDQGIIQELENSPIGEVLHKYRIVPDNFGRNSGFYCLYSYVLNVRSKLGIAEIKLPFSNISNLFKFDIPDKSFVVYMANGGETVLTLNSGNVSENQINQVVGGFNFKNTEDKKYYVITQDISLNTNDSAKNDRIAMFIPKAYIYKQMLGFAIFIILAVIVVIASIFFSVFITSTLVTKRLKALLNQTNTNIDSFMTNDTFEFIQGNDEFSKIDARFYELISKVKEYYAKITAYDMEEKSVKLKLLQERINPHLLYNTLSSIKCAYPDESLRNVIDSMVKYYRIALNKGNEILTVSQEVDMINAYIKLQKFAYRLDLTYTIEIDEQMMNLRIFKHLLQPIVENAILHGINGLEGKGTIKINGEFGKNCILFTIEDNGAGMTQ